MTTLRAPTLPANGANIPALGLGTFRMRDDACIRAVGAAIDMGYRHIDTAVMYANEVEVGKAIAATSVPRSEIFLTTKVLPDEIGAGALQTSAEGSLGRLGLDYVDLLLIHWPNARIPLAESIEALCDVKKRGLARNIGVANFTMGMVDEAVMIAFVSYCPVGQGRIVDDPVIVNIAARHRRTPAQVVLRWHMQQSGVAAIPKAATPAHQAQNLTIFDFALSDEDMSALSGLAVPNGRLISPAFGPKWD